MNSVANNQEAEAVLKELGIPPNKVTEPLIAAAQRALDRLGSRANTVIWFRKYNPLLGSSPIEQVRKGQLAKLNQYIDQLPT